MNTPAIRRSNPAAVLSLAALFTYYEIFRWIPLGRWNGQPTWPVVNDQFYPDLVIGALLLLFLWSFASAGRWGAWLATGLLGLWVVAHSFDWWIPYARSLPQNAGRYSFYAAHTQLLPVVGFHFPPDAGHAVLDFLLFPTFLLVALATIRWRPHA